MEKPEEPKIPEGRREKDGEIKENPELRPEQKEALGLAAEFKDKIFALIAKLKLKMGESIDELVVDDEDDSYGPRPSVWGVHADKYDKNGYEYIPNPNGGYGRISLRTIQGDSRNRRLSAGNARDCNIQIVFTPDGVSFLQYIDRIFTKDEELLFMSDPEGNYDVRHVKVNVYADGGVGIIGNKYDYGAQLIIGELQHLLHGLKSIKILGDEGLREEKIGE